MRSSLLFGCLLTLTFTACKGDEPSGDSAAPVDTEIIDDDTSGPVDVDADGVSSDEDCDDNDRAIYPGADEVCDNLDNNCDGLIDVDAIDPQTFYSDADEDGFAGDALTVSACEAPDGFSDTITDCDDLNAAAFPGGIEVCDGADNDCDGLTDDDDSLASGEGSAWLPDDDGDGFGDGAAATVTACVAPIGFVAEGGDCDSTDAAIYPGAVESCDALDNDCDGLTDDDDDGVSGLSTWYADADADTYGGSRYSTQACDAPSGYVADKTDCDDLNDAAFPGGLEVCDGADNDCDGIIDDDDPSVDTSDGITVYLDGDGDGFGVDGSGLMLCVMPSGYTTLDGDCDDSLATVSPDGVEVCNSGYDEDCSGDAAGCGVFGSLSISDADITLTGSASSDLGYELGGGDINGDGYDDLVVGASGVTINRQSNVGRSYVLYGPLTADRTVTSSYDATIDGAADSDYAGTALAVGGDVNGDGYDDIAVGAANYDPSSGSLGGLVGLRYGSATKLSGKTSIDALDASFAGAASRDFLGTAVKFIGDVNGDGYDELAVGASGTGSPYVEAGAVYIIAGSATRYSGMSTVTTAATLTITGADWYDSIGSIAGPIDLDGDGLNDLIIGSTRIDSGTAYSIGGAFIFYGSSATLSTSLSFSIAAADASFTGDAAYDYLARAPESAGDVNGDGVEDLVLGAQGVDSGTTLEVGCAYLIYGGTTRLSGAKSVSSAAAATMCGKAAADRLGISVGGADVNGDGYSDVYTGADFVDNGTTADAGALYVFYAPLSGSVSASAADATFTGSTSKGYVGFGSHTADVNGDGNEDILVGEYGAGKIYALFGGGL